MKEKLNSILTKYVITPVLTIATAVSLANAEPNATSIKVKQESGEQGKTLIKFDAKSTLGKDEPVSVSYINPEGEQQGSTNAVPRQTNFRREYIGQTWTARFEDNEGLYDHKFKIADMSAGGARGTQVVVPTAKAQGNSNLYKDEFWIGGGTGSTNSSILRDDGVLVEDKVSSSDFNFKLRERYSLKDIVKKIGATGEFEFYKASANDNVSGIFVGLGANQDFGKVKAWLIPGLATQSITGDDYTQKTKGFSLKAGAGNDKLEVEARLEKRDGGLDVVTEFGTYWFGVRETSKGLAIEYNPTKKLELRASTTQAIGNDYNVSVIGAGVSYSPIKQIEDLRFNLDYARTTGSGTLGSKLTGNYIGFSTNLENAVENVLVNPVKRLIK